MKIIDAKSVPPQRRAGKWPSILQKIPAGKAAVLENQVNAENDRISLIMFIKNHPEFKHFSVRRRLSTLYIINGKKESNK